MQIVREFDEKVTRPQNMDEFEALVVMGGPMSVNEQSQYHWIEDEIALIKYAIEKDIPVLGVCLGSQLLAKALGSQVGPGPITEIGWHPVTLTHEAQEDALWRGIGERFNPLHWHQDVYSLPHGACLLASSELTGCQAFRFRKAYGILFHLEMSDPMIRDWTHAFSAELHKEGISGQTILAGIDENLEEANRIGSIIFDRWVALIS